MNKHTNLLEDVLAAVNGRADARLFKNVTGYDNKRHIKYGIPQKGGSDLLGWVRIGGKAIFLSIEIKTGTGTLTEAQRNWIEIVKEFGGIAGVARTVEDALKLIEKEKK